MYPSEYLNQTTLMRFLSHSIEISGLLQYVYAALWEYVFIAKVLTS